VRVIDLDDEAVIVPVDKRRYKVSVRDESDTRTIVLIEPIEPPPQEEP